MLTPVLAVTSLLSTAAMPTTAPSTQDIRDYYRALLESSIIQSRAPTADEALQYGILHTNRFYASVDRYPQVRVAGAERTTLYAFRCVRPAKESERNDSASAIFLVNVQESASFEQMMTDRGFTFHDAKTEALILSVPQLEQHTTKQRSNDVLTHWFIGGATTGLLFLSAVYLKKTHGLAVRARSAAASRDDKLVSDAIEEPTQEASSAHLRVSTSAHTFELGQQYLRVGIALDDDRVVLSLFRKGDSQPFFTSPIDELSKSYNWNDSRFRIHVTPRSLYANCSISIFKRGYIGAFERGFFGVCDKEFILISNAHDGTWIANVRGEKIKLFNSRRQKQAPCAV